jgi:release factor glutamine methyltransferase
MPAPFELHPISIHELHQRAVKLLMQVGIDSAQLDSRLLLQHALGLSQEQLLQKSGEMLDIHKLAMIIRLVARRAQREPLAYITGIKPFWSLDFRVTPDTLIPRPDSETLIEAVLETVAPRSKPLKLLDIGTGTGCLLVSLLSEYPASQGWGTDISTAALDIASLNAHAHGFGARAQWLEGSWSAGASERFDVIVSNPPYIPEGDIERLQPEVAQYEPPQALSGGRDGLDAYRALIPEAKKLLKQEGIVVLEIGQGQQKDVATLLTRSDLHVIKTKQDLAGIPRALVAVHS